MIGIRKKNGSTAAEAAGGFVLALSAGYMLSDAQLAGAVTFADISLAGALSLPTSAAVLTGSLLRSIISENVGRNIVKIAAMIMILIIKLFFDDREEPKFCGIGTALSVFLAGVSVSVLIGEIWYKLIFYIVYGAISGYTAYSAAIIISGLKKRSVIDLTASGGCAYSVVYAIAISVLCTAHVPLIDLGIITGTAVTLGGLHFYRQTGGVVCGALTLCGAFLASPETGLSILLLPVAGLITGYVKERRYVVSAVVFVVTDVMLSVFTGISQGEVSSLINIVCGAFVFTVLAPFYSDRWLITEGSESNALPELMNARMSFLSDSIGNVRSESGRIAELLLDKADAAGDEEEISEQVCTHCFKRLFCWKNNYGTTKRGFRKLGELTEFSAETFPYELSDCLHTDELIELYKERSKQRATAKLLEMRFSESRQLMFEQIKIMEEMISAAGERLDVRYSSSVSCQVAEKLRKFGIVHNNVIAYYNSRNRLLIELYFSYGDCPRSFSRICDLISDELRIPLGSSEAVSSGKEVRVRLYEKPEYSLEVYGASMCAGGNKDNGDTSMVFGDGTGVSYVILSDGMGSGRKAAVESRLVVRLFRKLIGSGVNYISAIKMINSIMVTKSQEESFATLDAVRIDLDSGQLTVIKSGAASTLIKNRDGFVRVAAPNFPIGIYPQSEIYYRDCQFDEGDILIMFSDGVSENEYMYVKELLGKENDLKKIVDEICVKSEIFNPSPRSDDVTVIGVRMCRSQFVNM